MAGPPGPRCLSRPARPICRHKCQDIPASFHTRDLCCRGTRGKPGGLGHRSEHRKSPVHSSNQTTKAGAVAKRSLARDGNTLYRRGWRDRRIGLASTQRSSRVSNGGEPHCPSRPQTWFSDPRLGPTPLDAGPTALCRQRQSAVSSTETAVAQASQE
jgi:hypothetical protein